MRSIIGSKRFLAGATAALVGSNLGYRYVSSVDGDDQFERHTAAQHRDPPRFMSGMHQPFFAEHTTEERNFFTQNFADFEMLLSLNHDRMKERNSFCTPVPILPLSSCPISERQRLDLKNASAPRAVVVGGAPALLSSARDTGVLYINDRRQLSGADSSHWTLELDSFAQRPAVFDPVMFAGDQLRRVIYPETLGSARNTGFFSWRCLHWAAWLSHPELWSQGLRVLWGMREQLAHDEKELAREAQERAARSKANLKFFEDLNTDMKTKLLLFGKKGIIIFTRNRDEFEAVRQMRRALLLEGRQMQKLTPYHVDVKYGYEPKSMSLAVEKNYVRYIHPNFMQRVADFMKSRGNTVVDGVVTAVYTDCPELGGVVAYTSNSSSAETIYVPYSKLVMSLGTQHVVDAAGRPLVESVHARSVTGLATVYLKRGRKMPPSVVIGSTNRVTNIAGPVRVTRNNQEYDSFLVRMTCGACIAPDVASNDSLDYDAVAATGLVTALRRWLSCDVDVISIWGSNRQLTKYGEICWFQVNNSPTTGSSNLSISAIGPVRPKLEDMGTGIYIQVGAGENSIAQGPSQAMHPR